MNDFSEIESELARLRPSPPSTELFARVEDALVDLAGDDKIVRPDRFRINWLSLGLGLAAAAVLLIFARLPFDQPASVTRQFAARSPGPARSTKVSDTFLPAGATQVVYNMRDEGLHFSAGSDQPMRRVRSRMHETLHWQNAATGASLAVSYPTEQVELIPVSGQ